MQRRGIKLFPNPVLISDVCSSRRGLLHPLSFLLCRTKPGHHRQRQRVQQPFQLRGESVRDAWEISDERRREIPCSWPESINTLEMVAYGWHLGTNILQLSKQFIFNTRTRDQRGGWYMFSIGVTGQSGNGSAFSSCANWTNQQIEP